jgi:hypothetical protein
MIRTDLLTFRRGFGWTWFYPTPNTEWRTLRSLVSGGGAGVGTLYVRIVVPEFEGWKPDPDQSLSGDDIVWMIGEGLQWVVQK